MSSIKITFQTANVVSRTFLLKEETTPQQQEDICQLIKDYMEKEKNPTPLKSFSERLDRVEEHLGSCYRWVPPARLLISELRRRVKELREVFEDHQLKGDHYEEWERHLKIAMELVGEACAQIIVQIVESLSSEQETTVEEFSQIAYYHDYDPTLRLSENIKNSFLQGTISCAVLQQWCDRVEELEGAVNENPFVKKPTEVHTADYDAPLSERMVSGRKKYLTRSQDQINEWAKEVEELEAVAALNVFTQETVDFLRKRQDGQLTKTYPEDIYEIQLSAYKDGRNTLHELMQGMYEDFTKIHKVPPKLLSAWIEIAARMQRLQDEPPTHGEPGIIKCDEDKIIQFLRDNPEVLQGDESYRGKNGVFWENMGHLSYGESHVVRILLDISKIRRKWDKGRVNFDNTRVRDLTGEVVYLTSQLKEHYHP